MDEAHTKRASAPRRWRRMAALLLFAGLLAVSARGEATSVLWTQVDELGAKAELILRGRVQTQTVRRLDADFEVYTDYEIQIEALLGGTPMGVVIVRLPGGELDGQRVQVEGVPRLQQGVLYLMALEGVDAKHYGEAMSGRYYLPVGLRQGLWEVEHEQAVRHLEGVTFINVDGRVRAVPEGREAFQLDELERLLLEAHR